MHVQLADRAAGAVRLLREISPHDVAAAATDLASNLQKRQALSRFGQQAVDGYGALRVAFHVARLARRETAA